MGILIVFGFAEISTPNTIVLFNILAICNFQKMWQLHSKSIAFFDIGGNVKFIIPYNYSKNALFVFFYGRFIGFYSYTDAAFAYGKFACGSCGKDCPAAPNKVILSLFGNGSWVCNHILIIGINNTRFFGQHR